MVFSDCRRLRTIRPINRLSLGQVYQSYLSCLFLIDTSTRSFLRDHKVRVSCVHEIANPNARNLFLLLTIKPIYILQMGYKILTSHLRNNSFASVDLQNICSENSPVMSKFISHLQEPGLSKLISFSCITQHTGPLSLRPI